LHAWVAAILDGSRDCRSLQLLLLLRCCRCCRCCRCPSSARARPRARACRGEGGSRRSGHAASCLCSCSYMNHRDRLVWVAGLPLAAAAAAAAAAAVARRLCVAAPLRRPPLRDAGQGSRRRLPLRDAGRLRAVAHLAPAALAGCRLAPRRRPPSAGRPCGWLVGSAPSTPSRGSTQPQALAAGRCDRPPPLRLTRHRLIGVACAARPPLRDAGQDLRRQPPRRDAGRPALSASLRGSTRPGPLLSLAALALIDAVTSVRHRLCMSLCCCARLPSTDVGPSGLRARRGMASPGAVAFALRAARSRRSSASFPCWDCAPVSSRGTTAARAGLTARVILLFGQVRFRVIAGAPFGAPHGFAARPCDRASARNGLPRCSSSLLLSSSVTRAIEA